MELAACVFKHELSHSVYTDVGSIPWLSTFTGADPLAKFADYLDVQPEKPWYDLLVKAYRFEILACIEETAEYSNGVRTVMYKYGNE